MGSPFPETLGRVAVRAPAGDIDLFTAHIPHGSGHGWKKIDTFETLALALRGGTDSPRILTCDFNEPKAFLNSGQLLTFAGERVDADGSMSDLHKSWRGRPLEDWSKGVKPIVNTHMAVPLRPLRVQRPGPTCVDPGLEGQDVTSTLPDV